MSGAVFLCLYAKKYKDTNFPMHIIAATDTLTTGTFIYHKSSSN